MNFIISGFNQEYIKLFSKILNNKNGKILFLSDLQKKIIKKTLKRNKIIFILNSSLCDLQNKKLLNSLLFNIKNKKYKLSILYLDLNKINNQNILFNINEFLNTNYQIELFNQIKNIDSGFYINKKNKHNNLQIIPKLNLNVVISGVCIDNDEHLIYGLNKLLYLSIFFMKTTIIIYINENNLSENILNDLEFFKKNHQIIFIFVENNDFNKYNLYQKNAYARNSLLDYIQKNNIVPDYLIMFDINQALQEFKCDSILEPLNENINWSVFGGNSKIYYDISALRTIDFPYIDYSILDLEKNEKLKYYFKIDPDSKPIRVYSCFNGIAIYKYKHIIGCSYNGNENNEHVSFHYNIKKIYDANIFIHPKLLVGPQKILGDSMDIHFKDIKIIKDRL